ncbi:MAG: OmpA family protein [Myxococcota bacterium]|nr:OmpA family protein [Myxococcota bacterium]
MMPRLVSRMPTMVRIGAIAALLACMGACGPSYPECDTDEDCASHRQVCVDRFCRDCRDDSQCNIVDPCMVCSGYACSRQSDCCKTDLDCPGGRCWKLTGEPTGTCGGLCQDNSHCPAGQRCSGGNCVPDAECITSADCPEKHDCVDGKCLATSCEVEPIYFDFNENSIRLDQEGVVTRNAACLMQRLGSYIVEGHCDERGSDEYNLALSQRRAAAVVRVYESHGVTRSMLSTLGYGEEKPICVEGNEACWQQNRRVETLPR